MSCVEQRPRYIGLRDRQSACFSKPCHTQHLPKAGPVSYESDCVEKGRQRCMQDKILQSLESRKDDLERNHQALCMKTLDEIEKIERVTRARSGTRKSVDFCCEDLAELSIVHPSVSHHSLNALQPEKYEDLGFANVRSGTSPYLQSQKHSAFWLVAPKKQSLRKSGRGRRFQKTKIPENKRKSLQPFIPPGRLEDLGRLVMVTMKYYGGGLRLENDLADPRDEVLVEQQHCGGNTVYVFKDKLLPGANFSFPSYRHPGFPFSLTLYVNGRCHGRLSTCCEYRHRLNARLGGRNGHFAIARVEGGKPCCRCLSKCASKTRKKSESVNRANHESSDDGNSSGQETVMSISNRNGFDLSSSDDEDDEKERNFGGRSSDTHSRDSDRNGNPSGGQSPKLDEKDRDKDGYNHFFYDIKVPIDDEDDDCGDTAETGNQKKSKFGFKNWFKRS